MQSHRPHARRRVPSNTRAGVSVPCGTHATADVCIHATQHRLHISVWDRKTGELGLHVVLVAKQQCM